MPHTSDPHTAFLGHRRVAAGSLPEVALAAHRALVGAPDAFLPVFSDRTGKQVELDLRGTEAEVLARYAPPDEAQPAEPPADAPRGRGRPRLGVVAREVTLLPEHWDWLSAQPGGISVALRKLVHQARRASVGRDELRQAQDRAYAFMAAVAGDLPGFEEAARALFANELEKMAVVTSAWPEDVRQYVAALAEPGLTPSPAAA